MTKRCPNKKYLDIKKKREDFPFIPISEKDLEMENMMAKMKESGMGGMSMYNRDDMEEMMANGGYGGMGGMNDDNDDDSYGDMPQSMNPYGDDTDDESEDFMDAHSSHSKLDAEL